MAWPNEIIQHTHTHTHTHKICTLLLLIKPIPSGFPHGPNNTPSLSAALRGIPSRAGEALGERRGERVWKGGCGSSPSRRRFLSLPSVLPGFQSESSEFHPLSSPPFPHVIPCERKGGRVGGVGGRVAEVTAVGDMQREKRDGRGRPDSTHRSVSPPPPFFLFFSSSSISAGTQGPGRWQAGKPFRNPKIPAWPPLDGGNREV
ncbi:hypothetical protein LY76DRAFT_166092 [Colletotrichum caudatum]|nr:hypothetical protein LY76DRAFT_166092 [Colletotrichum caudatum]